MRSVTAVKCAIGALAGAAALGGAAHAEEARDISSAVADGDLILELRPRIEHVDQTGAADGDAFTMRTRLGWKTASWNGLQGLVEFEDVRQLGGNEYNDGVPPAEPFASISDPDVTELNRLQLAWTLNPHLTATLGRQNINIDDQRFVGISNWRQDSQTFDAARLDGSIGGFKATYIYLDHVNRISAEEADWESEGHLFYSAQSFSEAFRLAGFVYALDFSTPSAINQSSRTAGVRATGQVEQFDTQFDYALTWANIQDYAASTAEYDLDYWGASVNAKHGPLTARVSYESLEGDGARGFLFPIASAHNFHGWAGVFGAKPADGLNDFNASLAYEPGWAPSFLPGLELTARWYAFEAERTGADFGNEIDLMATADLTERLSLMLKSGDYEGGGPGSPADMMRTWIGLEYKL